MAEGRTKFAGICRQVAHFRLATICKNRGLAVGLFSLLKCHARMEVPMSLTLPPDLGEETVASLQWHPDDPVVRRFRTLVADGVAFSPHRPRELLRIANAHAVPMTGPRYVAMMLTGFHAPGRARLMAAAIARLRQAISDVESGKEPGLIYAGGQGAARLRQRRGAATVRQLGQAGRVRPPAATALSSGQIAAAREAIAASNAAAAPAAATPASTPAASGGPRFPRGTVFTRPLTGANTRSRR
jgi:hypothetical protein